MAQMALAEHHDMIEHSLRIEPINRCVYRKLKHGRSGDGVRPRRRVN